MNTAEMWLKAQKDGKIYKCTNGDMVYSKTMGLVADWDFECPWGLESFKDYKERGIDELLNGEWEEMTNVMTIEEAEEKFGIRILPNTNNMF